MPKTLAEVKELLNRLNACSADELEGQDVDFKEWSTHAREALTKAVQWAVCMANGGGGTIVFGVADDLVGRANAVVGVPQEMDVNRVRQAIYDRTDPKLTPAFDEIEVAEGTGRVVAMHVHPGIPPYTDTSGKGLIRVGKDCMPLTGAMRRQHLFEVRAFVAEEGTSGVELGVDYLLILQHLLRHAEIEATEAARLCQRTETDVADILLRLESKLGYLDRGGGRNAYWTLRPEVHARLVRGAGSKGSRRSEWKVAKGRVLNVIRRQAVRGEDPLVNSDVRRITGFDRHQVYRLVQELVAEGRLLIDGHGRAARYVYRDRPEDR